jgi:hypothetical protein
MREENGERIYHEEISEEMCCLLFISSREIEVNGRTAVRSTIARESQLKRVTIGHANDVICIGSRGEFSSGGEFERKRRSDSSEPHVDRVVP